MLRRARYSRSPRGWLTLAAGWVLVFASSVLPAPEGLAERLESQHSLMLKDPSDAEGGGGAQWVRDAGRVSVVSYDGDYDRSVAGAPNLSPRMAVASEFLADHADAYDFVVTFTGFDFDLDSAAAFHLGVRNDVEGIGLDLFDQSGPFGSEGVLRGYVDAGPLDRLEADRLDPGFEQTLALLLHELMHQWGGYVEFDDGGAPSSVLRQSDGRHWSFLLDSDASVLYGNDWLDNGDGTFTAGSSLRSLSPLDLYLAGILGAGEVADFLLLESPGTDPDRLPEPNSTIVATARTLSIDDIVAAEGPRIPEAGASPSVWRLAFVLLVRPGEDASDAQLVALEEIRAGLISRFAALTGGRATLEIAPLPKPPDDDGPPTIDGGDPRPTPAEVEDALAWLRVEQSPEGFWEDRPSTRVRDSAVALATLREIDPLFTPAASTLGEAWLQQAVPSATDLLARRSRLLPADSTAKAALAARQNPDGGWGFDREFLSNPMDTALAIFALDGFGFELEVQAGRAWLEANAAPAGGWGMVAAGAPRVASTAAALNALPQTASSVPAALAWLASKQNPDGGFGESPSTAHATALAVSAFLDRQAIGQLGAGLEAAESFLATRQDVPGSWEGSVYTTALVARTLQRLALPNWRLEPLEVEPVDPVDGEVVRVTIPVANDGSAQAPLTVLRLFDGDPGSGVLIAERVVPALAAGAGVEIEILWDTRDLAGDHLLVAVVDPDSQTGEVSESDNRSEIAVEVAEAPVEPDLALGEGDVVATPGQPSELPVVLRIDATVHNLGQTEAADAVFSLWQGEPGNGVPVSQQTATVPARSSVVVPFSAQLTSPGTTLFTVVADPLDTIAEADEDNNTGSVEVTTVPSLDLEIDDSDLAVAPDPAYVGQDVLFTVTIRNRGTIDSPLVGLRLRVTDGAEVRDLPVADVFLSPGSSTTREVPWRVDLSGPLVFTAEADSDQQVPESDETNNAGSLAFEALEPDQPNLAIGPGDLTASPDPGDEGRPATLSAVVRNTGVGDLVDVEVGFFDGDPAAGGVAIDDPVVVPLLASGAVETVEYEWAEVPDAADRTLVVVADPGDLVAELDEDDNSAFLSWTVSSLPDPAVGSGSLALDPPRPPAGSQASVTVSVDNLGEQPVDVVVRVLEGEGDAAESIDGDQSLSIDGLSAAFTTFDWTLDDSPGARTLTAIVDPDDELREGSELNNEISIVVSTQSADFQVTAPFFSPDGDGVLDTTAFSWPPELDAVAEIVVLDFERETEVRRVETAGPGSTFVWDGRNDSGHTVRDAAYLLRAVDAAGIVLGQAEASVDRNRLSALAVREMPDERQLNLTCRPNPEDYRLEPSERWGYFKVDREARPDAPKGLYRSRPDEGIVQRVVTSPWLLETQAIGDFTVSADGGRVGFQRLEYNDPLDPTDDTVSLWVAGGDGSGFFELDIGDPPLGGAGGWELLGFSSGADELLVAHGALGLLSYPLTGGGPRLLAGPGSELRGFSPDQSFLLVEDAVGLHVLEISSGELRQVFEGVDRPASWSPDSRELAVVSGRFLHLVDPSGATSRVLELPELLDGVQPFTTEARDGPAWSSKSPELATIVGYEDPLEGCFPWYVLFTVDLDTGEVVERGRSEPGLPCQFQDPGFGEGAGGETIDYPIAPGQSVSWDPADRTLMMSSFLSLILDGELGWVPVPPPGIRSSLSPTGRYWSFESRREVNDPEHPCFGNPGGLIDVFAARDRGNLGVSLRPLRPPDSDGVELFGTATDRHFSRWELEWSESAQPGLWRPIGSPSSVEIEDALMTTWVPPGPGLFTVRMSAADRAGNVEQRRVRIASSSTPDVRGVEVEPRLFSPNGDGRLDEAVVSYEVVSPTVVRVRVLNEAGVEVREFVESYPSGGLFDSVVWDGRDEAGLVVPDGDYEVRVQQYRFPVEIDNTPPTVSIAASVLTRDSILGSAGDLRIEARSFDRNPDRFAIEGGLEIPPSTWEVLPTSCSREAGGFDCSALLSPGGFTGRSFRVRPRDLAGNESLASDLAPEALVITRFGAHELGAGGEFLPLQPVDGSSFEMPTGAARLRVAEAVVEELLDLTLEYRPAPTGTEPDPPWTDAVLGDIFEPGSMIPVAGYPDPLFEALWETPEVTGFYQVRLRGLDADLVEHRSEPISLGLTAAESLSFASVDAARSERIPAAVRTAALDAGYDLDEIAFAWGVETFEGPLTDFALVLESDEDPDYLFPRSLPFLTTFSDSPATPHRSEVYFVMEDFRACNRYTGTLSATTSEGGEESSVPGEALFPCLRLDIEALRFGVGACGAPPETRRDHRLTPRSLSGLELSSLVVFDPAGEEVLRIDEPVDGVAYPWMVETADLDEGPTEYRLELTDVEGNLTRSNFSVVADRTPPAVGITYPEEGEKVCGVALPEGSAMTFEGALTDSAGLDFFLDYGRGAAPTEWFRAEVIPGDDDGNFDPVGELEFLSDGTVRLGEELVFDYDGPLSRYASIVDEAGVLTGRLRAVDRGGHLVCDEVTFEFDGLVAGTQIRALPSIFSPNGDGVLEATDFTASALAEPVVATLEIFEPAATFPPTQTGPPLATLLDEAVLAGSSSVAWDGADDLGALLPDGRYLAVLTSADGCGNAIEQVIAVEIDTIAPVQALLSPTAGTPLPIVVPVFATVGDRNLESWGLDYALAAEPDTYFPLASGAATTPGVPLFEWNTLGLEGEYLLRLASRDVAGNRSETTVLLDFDDRLSLLTYFEAVPDPFSPNGDGRRETTALRFGLDAEAAVEVSLSGPASRTLVSGATYPAGAHVVSWDGMTEAGAPMPDGVYEASVEATLIADPLVSQTESTYVTLDREPPLVEFASPSEGGYVTSSTPIEGTIADPHLISYSVALDGIEIAAGDSSVVDRVFGGLAGYDEGVHSLSVEAADAAENEISLEWSFVIDDTAPIVELDAPVAGAALGNDGNPHPVAGRALDENLDSWTLDYGEGSSPASWQILATSDLAIDGQLFMWDVSALAEGDYVLRLSAVDRAGGERQVSVPLLIDTTPPDVALQQPASGEFVREPLDVVGTASDFRLAEYDVGLAVRGGSSFVPLFGGEVSVVDGVLGRWATLPPDDEYDLRLTATDVAGNAASVVVPVTVDTTPPAVPTGVAATLLDPFDARISWTPVTAPDLAGYFVYRDSARLNGQPVAGATYDDPELPEGTYDYRVSAIDLAGNESEPSVPAALVVDRTPPATALFAPAPGERVSGLVVVEGTASSDGDFLEYRLAAVAGDGSSIELVTSSTPIANGVLGLWDTIGLGEESEWTLRLEAEDLHGNVATAQVVVVVDNLPPAAPTGLVAAPAGSDVTLTWNANAEPDLLGYLLFRNDELVNGEGSILDYRPFALTATEYDDLGLPDGEFVYRVFAIDEAGNLSPPSQEASATLDTGPPAALIYEPEDGSQFQAPIVLRAESDDLDVEQVQFELRESAGAWLPLGEPLDERPFDVPLDPQGVQPPLEFGFYEVRAVATDEAGNVDPAPESITLEYRDLTPPGAVLGLQALVSGEDVALSWDPSPEPDLDGYRVFRYDADGNESQLTLDPISGESYDDAALADGSYAYRVRAVDLTGNESELSEEAGAFVYAPLLELPWSPTLSAQFDLPGSAVADSTVDGEVVNGTALPVGPASANGDGNFVVPSIPLRPGTNEVRLRALDGAGNTSRDATVQVDRGEQPAPPDGLGATVQGFEVELSWNPHPDADVVGYRPHRDGVPVDAERPVAGVIASASSDWRLPGDAIDGDSATYWGIGPELGSHWLELELAEPAQTIEVRLDWSLSGVSWELEVWTGWHWLTLAQGEDDTATTFRWSGAYRTDRVRLALEVGQPFGVAIREVEVREQPVLSTTTLLDTVTDGTFVYAVTAIDDLGFESDPSEVVTVEVGDVEPPEPVVLSGSVVDDWDVSLSWTESASNDVTAYTLYRDGEFLASNGDPANRTYLDVQVPNGTHSYIVRAVDGAGNESVDSNPVVLTIDVAPPGVPTGLEAAQVAGTPWVDLSWDPPLGSVAGYLVERSAGGGSWIELASALSPSWRDRTSMFGGSYRYRVRAFDDAGNTGNASAEAQIVVGVPAPRLHFPTVPGIDLVTGAASIDVAGTGLPGAVATLLREGFSVATATVAAEDSPRIAALSEPAATGLLSPDGERLFYRDVEEQAGVYSFETSGSVLLPGSPTRAAWLRDSRRLVFVTDSFSVRMFDAATGLVTVPAAFDSARAVAASPVTDRWVVLGMLAGVEGLHLVADGSATTVRALDTSSVAATSLRWSPDDASIAYRQVPSGQLRVLDLADGSERMVAPALLGSPSWAPDGARLVFAAPDGAGIAQLHEVEVETGGISVLTQAGGSDPSWAPDGSRIAYQGASELRILSLPTDESRSLASCVDTCTPQWVASGDLLQSEFERAQTRWTVEGSFLAEGVGLEIGANDLRATQELVASESGESQPIVVVRLGDLPDLAVAETGLQVVPVPVDGSPALFQAVVENLGAATPATEVQMVLVGPDDSTQSLDPVGVPALAAGESFVAAIEATAAAGAGFYTLVAGVDPTHQIQESDESNNAASRRFAVLEQPGVTVLAVETDADSYGADEEVAISGFVVHGGEPTTGTVEAEIVDALGLQVVALPTVPIDLPDSTPVELGWSWNTATSFAGEYRAEARILDASAVLLDTAVAPFEVLADFELSSTVASDLPSYLVGEPVGVEAVVSYGAGNVVLRGVEGAIVVTTPSGGEITVARQTFGDLLPGGSSTMSVIWESVAAEPGLYALRFETTFEGEVVSTGFGTFVLAESGSVGGSLTVVPATAHPATPVGTDYSILNEGPGTLDGVPVTVALIDPVAGAIVAELSRAETLPPDVPVDGSFEFQTGGLALGDYAVVLSVDLGFPGPPDEIALDVQPLRLRDLEPPLVALLDPAADGFVGAARRVVVAAEDLLSGVERVEVEIDDGGWRLAPPLDPASGRFALTLVRCARWRPLLEGASDRCRRQRGDHNEPSLPPRHGPAGDPRFRRRGRRGLHPGGRSGGDGPRLQPR